MQYATIFRKSKLKVDERWFLFRLVSLYYSEKIRVSQSNQPDWSLHLPCYARQANKVVRSSPICDG